MTVLKQLITIVLLALPLSNVICQDPYVVDSILLELPEVSKQDKSPYYSELAWQYILSDIDKSYDYAIQGLNCAEFSKDSSQLSEIYNTLGAVYMRRTNYDSALYFNHRALEIRLAQGDKRGIAGTYSKLGMIYTDQGYFDKALDYQLRALKLFIETEDPYAEAQTYNNICQIYNYLENLEMAIFYSNKCIKMYETLEYPYGEATAIANLALYYEEKNMLDSAIYFTNKSIELFKSINDLADVANSENMLGIYLRKQGKDEEGLQHYLLAFKIAEDIGDGFSMAQFKANAAAVYLDLGRLDSALILYNESLNSSIELNLLRVERQCYDGLGNYFEITKDYKQSVSYRKLYEQLNDSIQNTELQEAMANADAKFQATYNKQLVLEKQNVIQQEQKEKAILSKENAEKESRLRYNQLLFTVIIFSIVVLVVLLVFWLNRKRLKREREYAINLAKEKELGLQKTIQAQEEERTRIARDLHDGIVQDLVAIKMGLNSEKEVLPEEIKHKLDKAAGEIRAISHAMMPYSLKELSFEDAIDDLLQKVMGHADILVDCEYINPESQDLSNDVKINLYRIIQELLNNTIKHSKAKNVTIMVSLRNGSVTLTYEDDGVGFSEKQKVEGIGLINIQSRVGAINGDLKFESSPGEGVLYIVKAPIK